MLISLNTSGLKERSRIMDILLSVHVDLRLSYESTDPSEVGVYTPGFGTINCHFGLINVNLVDPSYHSVGLHRSRDPDAGAFTYWHNMTLIATRVPGRNCSFIMDLITLIRTVHSINERNPASNSTKHTLIGEEFWGMARTWITIPEVVKAFPETYGEFRDVRA
jgi:hypothetical protein